MCYNSRLALAHKTQYETLPFCHMNTVACRYGDMRLADGGTEAEGRVELCIDNRWGTVCDNRWNENSTAVACKHLGFSEIVNGKLKISIPIIPKHNFLFFRIEVFFIR